MRLFLLMDNNGVARVNSVGVLNNFLALPDTNLWIASDRHGLSPFTCYPSCLVLSVIVSFFDDILVIYFFYKHYNSNKNSLPKFWLAFLELAYPQHHYAGASLILRRHDIDTSLPTCDRAAFLIRLPMDKMDTRLYFQMHFHEWKDLHFDLNFTCHGANRATSHCLKQCWPSSPTHICSTRGRLVKAVLSFAKELLRAMCCCNDMY